MSIDQERLSTLTMKFKRNTITPEERLELETWLKESETNQRRFDQRIDASWVLEQMSYYDDAEKFKEEIRERVYEKLDALKKITAEPVVRHMPWRTWTRVAAVLALLAASLYLFRNYLPVFKTNPEVKTAVAQDFHPGDNKAILTLAGGRQLVLNNTNQDTVLTEGEAIVAGAAGRLVYNAANRPDVEAMYNTLTTPRGGQYQLTLPDGTKVWLNAASSITYPTAFGGKTREVTITGEAYLEVARNEQMPFAIKTKNQVIDVLGTSINVSAYADDKATMTTLVEGAIKVSCNGHSRILKPGQQAMENADGSLTVKEANIRSVTAWKRGFFNFDNEDIRSIMTKLGRWYAIDVQYDGKVPQQTFDGNLSRDLNLSEVVAILQSHKLNIHVENNKLIITQ